jgi:hypothetical protein
MARRAMAVWLLFTCVFPAIGAFAPASLAQGSNPAPGDARDLKTVIESGVLRVALTSFNLPAFHRRVDGQWPGPEIELSGKSQLPWASRWNSSTLRSPSTAWST